MTVPSNVSRVSYTGSGTTGPFPIPYPFLEDAHIKVVRTTIADGAEIVMALTVDYTLTGSGGASGTLTLVSALSSAYELSIIRDPDELQLVDLQPNDNLPAETLEKAYDKLTMLVQRLFDLIARSVRLSDGDTSGADLTLPTPTAGNTFGWNATATALVNIALQTGTTLVNLAAATGSALIGFIQAGTGAVLRTVQDKLRDRVSLFDFMTAAEIADVKAGTQLVDVSAAVNAAFALGKSVYGPQGTYRCDSVVDLPANIADIVIDLTETTFVFTHASADAVGVHGAIRCRLHFGYIQTNSTGSAIIVDPVTNGFAENILTFRGLTGTSRTGIGLQIKGNSVGASVSRFIGSDISEFEYGVKVIAAGGAANIDTMQYDFNYIRTCDFSIYENGSGGSSVNAATWKINFEASASGDVGLKTNAVGNRYECTHYTASGGTLIVLDANAANNDFIFVNPWTLADFPGSTLITNNSTNTSNRFGPSHPADLVETYDATAGAITLGAAGIVGGIYLRNGGGAPWADTTDTAANIIAALKNPYDGLSFPVYMVNATGVAWTINAGTDVTIAGTNTVPASSTRVFQCVVTNASGKAVKMNGL